MIPVPFARAVAWLRRDRGYAARHRATIRQALNDDLMAIADATTGDCDPGMLCDKEDFFLCRVHRHPEYSSQADD